VESSGPQISPSGIEQAPAPGEADRDRLRLEPPPPVLARAPSPTDSPPAQAAPPIVAAPGDDGRSATQPTYRIQLASVREEADARRAWDLYRLELGDVLADFAPVIERAEIANGTFYRVQAGAFGDRLEAEAICEELKARNTACLVVRR
jgi:cell division septation protein DedD